MSTTKPLGHHADPDPVTHVCWRCARHCIARRDGTWMHGRGAVCGAPMRYGETCARYAGHADGRGGGHRTQFAVENRRLRDAV